MESVTYSVLLREGKRPGENDPLIMMMGGRRGERRKGKEAKKEVKGAVYSWRSPLTPRSLPLCLNLPPFNPQQLPLASPSALLYVFSHTCHLIYGVCFSSLLYNTSLSTFSCIPSLISLCVSICLNLCLFSYLSP